MARSKRRLGSGPAHGARVARGARARGAVRGARRVWPYVLMAWERWQSLSPEEKERYKKQARGFAQRGKKTLDEQRRRRPPRS
jgi:glycogen debranching enzyme